ncbi:MAG: 4Fe-4S binding protein [Candidatus Aminicenantes bacterium]|nr:4Fe-4S binding protein [Candidatus Aminicenantes bacterium]
MTHGFRIDQDKCRGCLSCMRACPTHAIRVRDGKARYIPEKCIDCGSCLKSCPYGAITATTWSFQDMDKFKFKVAVPSPVLFGQFPAGVTPAHIVQGLLSVGFDAVWDYGVELFLASRAVLHYVENWKGPFPLISVSCPVVVRLVQVSYPRMIDQLIRLQIPREIAGREIKRRYAKELGLRPDEIAAVYITPCQAKTISILHPAEGVESHLNGALGISEVYNPILASANQQRNGLPPPAEIPNIVRNSTFLGWSVREGLGRSLARHNSLHVTGLANIIQVFDDIEKGKLQNVEFLEAHSCWSGCTGGNLTVANVYVTLSKLRSLVGDLPEMDAETLAEVNSRYPLEDFSLEAPVLPRPIKGQSGDLREKVRLLQEAEAVLKTLPGYNCGLCGAPTCKEMAKDISAGEASKADCVFFSKDRLSELYKRFLLNDR